MSVKAMLPKQPIVSTPERTTYRFDRATRIDSHKAKDNGNQTVMYVTTGGLNLTRQLFQHITVGISEDPVRG
jgi:hypothetical protein